MMMVSVRSLAVMCVLPRMSMVIEIGLGDSNVGIWVLLGVNRWEGWAPLAGPAGEALAAAWTRLHAAMLRVGRCPPTAAETVRTSHELTDRPLRPAASSIRAFSCSGRRKVMRDGPVSSPSVDRSADAGRRWGQSTCRLSDRRVVDRRCRHDELRIAATQAHVDRAGSQIERDLGCGGRDRIQQDESCRRLERGSEPTGDDSGVIAAGLSSDLELVPQLFNVLRQIHAAIVTSFRRHVNRERCHYDVTLRAPGALGIPSVVYLVCLGMHSEQLKGHLDPLVLAVLEGGPLHGYGIIEQLRLRSEGVFDLPEGTVYPALHRLEAGGLVSSAREIVNGRDRRVYRLTRRGRAALAGRRKDWLEFSSAMSTVLTLRLS